MALVSEQIPKSNRGRKGTELNQADVEGLAKLLKEQPVIDNRPAGHRTDDVYTTKGRASSQGRRYADAVAEILKKQVRVNVFEYTDENGEGNGTFGWRLYLSMEPVKKEKKS
jgi:hypothetical protein